MSVQVGFLVFLLGYLLYYQKVLANKTNMDKLKQTLLAVYLFLVACVTILPIDFTLHLKWQDAIQPTYIHLLPFEDLRLRHGGAQREVILNVMMTIPFGFLYAWIKEETTWLRLISATALLSISIEGIQLMMTIFLLHHRSCDITDVITNTMGGIVGFLFYQVYRNMNRRKTTPY